VIALRETMGFNTVKALLATTRGFVVYLVTSITLGVFVGGVSALTQIQLR
jgi:hypothetical protein